jgi:hypothetical protein
MSEPPPLIRLKPSWLEVSVRLEALGFEPLPLLAARHGVELGHYSEQCPYEPDPEIWAWYRTLPAQS